MKIVLTAAALCLGMMSAQAQTGKAPTGVVKDCLASTTDKDWGSLGLNSEQAAQVKQLQADWRKEESSKAAEAKAGTKESPIMDSYEAKVQSVLSPEQYQNWVKWCSTHASKPMKQKAESATSTEEDMSE